jgi:hypothetical protein
MLHQLMIAFDVLCEFSRSNCIGVCTFFIPIILLATLSTIILAAINRPKSQIWLSTGIASIFIGMMIFHVYSWFIVGIVMIPTYILLGLSVICSLANFAAILWCYNSTKLIYPTKSFIQQ